jgi:hypothetical protein
MGAPAPDRWRNPPYPYQLRWWAQEFRKGQVCLLERVA